MIAGITRAFADLHADARNHDLWREFPIAGEGGRDPSCPRSDGPVLVPPERPFALVPGCSCHGAGHDHRADSDEPGQEGEHDADRAVEPAAGDDRRGKADRGEHSRPIQNSAVRTTDEPEELTATRA